MRGEAGEGSKLTTQAGLMLTTRNWASAASGVDERYKRSQLGLVKRRAEQGWRRNDVRVIDTGSAREVRGRPSAQHAGAVPPGLPTCGALRVVLASSPDPGLLDTLYGLHLHQGGPPPGKGP